MGRVHERVPALAVLRPPPVLELLTDDRQVGQPQDQTAPQLLVDAVELEVAAEDAVIAPLDLLQALQVRVELRLGRPDGAVDPLQLGVVLVATPVGAGDRHELERSDLPGALDVGPPAEVREDVVGVHADLAVLDGLIELLDLVDLVVLMLCAEEVERLRDVHLAALEGDVLLDHRAHPLLDLLEIVGLERPRQVEVVVEAVGHGRAEAELGLREQLEHRTRHHVRGRVPQRVQRVGSVIGLPGHLVRVGLRHSSSSS